MSHPEWMNLAHRQLQWLEAHRHPALDAVFLTLTGLGSEPVLILVVAIGYWWLDRGRFARAAGMLVVAALLNTGLKGFFLEPRPAVIHVHATGGWSFPSGHAQVGAALWGWLAHEIGGRSGAAAALWLLAALVSMSRPYLGVHYPHDVVAGFALGAAQVALFATWRRRGPRAPAWLRGPGAVLIGAGLLTWLVLSTFHPSVQTLGLKLAGAGTGLALGVCWCSLPVPGAALHRAWLLGLGLLGLAGLLIVLAPVFAEAGPRLGPWLRYAAVGAWITAGAPHLAARLAPRA